MTNSPSDTPIELQGRLLLAAPTLRDGVFDRSVILLANHSAADGAMGLILNHPIGKSVGDLLPGPDFEAIADLPVHLGGPVSSDHLTFAAFHWDPLDGLQCEFRIPTVEAAKQHGEPGTLVRAFVGYSGWSAGQLEKELRRDSWIPVSPSADILGAPLERELWSDILRELSPYHRILAEAPEDPQQN